MWVFIPLAATFSIHLDATVADVYYTLAKWQAIGPRDGVEIDAGNVDRRSLPIEKRHSHTQGLGLKVVNAIKHQDTVIDGGTC